VQTYFQEQLCIRFYNLPVILISAAEVNFIKAEVYFRASDAANASLSLTLLLEDLSSLGLAAETADYLTNH
jgi:hypothetical protein